MPAAIRVEYERPKLYPKQLDAIFDPARYSVIEASTKSGKTAGCIAWLVEQALLHGGPGRNYWWLAPIYTQADIAYRRLKAALPKGSFTANETKLTITLPNGAVLSFRSGEKPDSLYGEDVWAAVVDEASRLREEAWHALRTTLSATQGSVRLIGNVHGRQNWFYALARKAEAGEPEMAYHRLIAADAIEAGILTKAEVEDARRQLPDLVFRELYLAEAAVNQANPFGADAILGCVAPLSKAEPVTWGWDLAKSVDWTVGIGLDGYRAVSRLERFQAPWQETINRIHTATGRVRALVDSTGVGDPILEALQRKGGNYQGFRFSQTSKQQLMEGLAVAIQRHEVTFPDGPIVAELQAFEYAYSRTGVTYSAPEGFHDDCVCALAMALSHHLGGFPLVTTSTHGTMRRR